MKRNKGVSLIILVITIIVIIIIAGAVILSLSNNNPIAQASEATFKQNVQAYCSEVDMYLSSQYASTLGAYDPALLEADSTKATYNGAAIAGKPNIYSILSSLDPTSADGGKFAIKKGKLIYTGTDSKVADWIEESSLESLYIPTLGVTAKPTDNKVYLSWKMSDTAQPYTYKIYQQKEGVGAFQTISTNNLKSNIKVLNIYPVVGSTITFTNWKGQSFTLPKSASVKMWMEQANVDDPKGYGKGLIDVDCVSSNDFNANPTSYMKNADGTWKYDAVFEGTWDWNGATSSASPTGQLNATSLPVVEEFIRSGRGYLMGHDTIVANNPAGSQYDYKLRSYFNIGVTTIDYPQYGGSSYGNSVAVIQKKGLLTTYPWNIGELGTQLSIPYSHVLQQFARGDVWLTYADAGHSGSILPVADGATNNFYLTTWNNTAMIQTGHSNATATADEQKVLANTLFYLSQLTSDTSLEDNSGQDVKAPTDPVITAATINGGTGKVDITFSASVDQGSTYSYYVEAIGQNNAAVTKTGIRSTIITSGIAGYSVVVDTSPSTVPASTVNTTTLTTSITKPAGTDIYVHIKAIDNRGNVSTTVHRKAS